ncbi:hypothetical protein OSTOST_13508 [Ostertagia ostertagi]
MSSHDSAHIRRQIGALKRQLQRHVSTVASLLQEYNVEPTTCKLDHCDEDELQSLRDNWTVLQQSDANEKRIFEDYIGKYGDYRGIIADTVTHLEQCDELLNFIDKRYARQKLNPPSDSSDASRDNHDTHRQPRSHEIRKTATLHSIANSYHRHPIAATDSTLLNFVDASILTKLELPTFDGNCWITLNLDLALILWLSQLDDTRYARQKLNPPSDSSEASRDNHDTHRQPRSHEIRRNRNTAFDCKLVSPSSNRCDGFYSSELH